MASFITTDVPQSILSLGTSLNGSNIKEGDDVYFECNVRANPRPYKITWRFNVSETHFPVRYIQYPTPFLLAAKRTLLTELGFISLKRRLGRERKGKDFRTSSPACSDKMGEKRK